MEFENVVYGETACSFLEGTVILFYTVNFTPTFKIWKSVALINLMA